MASLPLHGFTASLPASSACGHAHTPTHSPAGVRLADGRVFRGRTIISNATRWDTFEGLVGKERMPRSESLFRYTARLRLECGATACHCTGVAAH
jgi:hypothetical protein